MKSLLIIICLFLFLWLPTNAQNIGKYSEEYEAFKRQAIQEYNDFRDRANAEYAQYMRDAWAWYRGEKPMPAPTIEEPIVPPVVLPEKDRGKTPEERPLPFDEVIPSPEPAPVPTPVSPIQEKPQPVERRWNIAFYGTQCNVRFETTGRILLKNTKENAVADMWEQLAKSGNNLLRDCLNLRDELNLCDWAFLKLAEAVAHEIYASGHANEAVLLQSFILNQSGFKIHIARSNDNRLHLLIAADCDMYGYPYWELNGEHYYLTDGSGAESLYIFTKAFPDEQPMRLTIAEENRFANQSSPERTLQAEQYPETSATIVTNENLIEFYNDYPESYANNDPLTKWRFYAQTPLSRAAKDRLYPVLRKAILGKSEQDAANILINFVQTAFVYEYDDKIWGCDRAFFADETLYYPYCDCEDRSILFSRLVRDLLGLDVVLVYYPGHLATAVHFNTPVPGDYLSVDGIRYLVCDPTYIHAPIGMTMPDMDNSKAKIILLK